jgi:hypothetical protein
MHVGVLAVQGALNSMRTPGVLAFLHLLAAAILQLVLAAWQILESPQISTKATKGASVQALLNGVQVRSVLCKARALWDAHQHVKVYTEQMQ